MIDLYINADPTNELENDIAEHQKDYGLHIRFTCYEGKLESKLYEFDTDFDQYPSKIKFLIDDYERSCSGYAHVQESDIADCFRCVETLSIYDHNGIYYSKSGDDHISWQLEIAQHERYFAAAGENIIPLSIRSLVKLFETKCSISSCVNIPECSDTSCLRYKQFQVGGDSLIQHLILQKS